MRGSGLFFGRASRNDPIRLIPQRFEERTLPFGPGDAGQDGYTVLSRADPNYAGRLPPVPGTAGETFRGPDDSFEQ